MITEICKECRNFFAADRATKVLFGAEFGEFALGGGVIEVNGNYVAGQYVAITGSALNDGVYRVAGFSDGVMTLEGELFNESWAGVIYSLRIPRDFIALAEKIKAFAESDAGQPGNITSASFGIQSVSYGTNSAGVRAGWQDTFRAELNKYRRMFSDIDV